MRSLIGLQSIWNIERVLVSAADGGEASIYCEMKANEFHLFLERSLNVLKYEITI